jgi:hypothetical protein
VAVSANSSCAASGKMGSAKALVVPSKYAPGASLDRPQFARIETDSGKLGTELAVT